MLQVTTIIPSPPSRQIKEPVCEFALAEMEALWPLIAAGFEVVSKDPNQLRALQLASRVWSGLCDKISNAQKGI